MKKSKFLQNSKDMLSRSFNPAKCKTSLRLAGSRLKLLKNKKEVQVKQMKREIAQLLESGQDRTARIRVEHVIREEKMMAAYDLLEIYCELIVSRLPIIESQKNIPIDLKEAIASVVFASPRCGDVPEFLDIRKHITAKYGKDFTTAAIELRPECGVGRMLVEKLSAVAPDGQAKTKILIAIAEEHNISWDPKSSDEKDQVPPNELLSGPSTFGKASALSAEAPLAGDPDIQAAPPFSDNKRHTTAFNVSQPIPKTSVGTENISSAQNYGIRLTSQSEMRPTGDKKTQMFQDENYASSFDRQRWNMEFKDATAAAQAAAESAERASMAARAAAELSNRDRIMRQNSSPKGHVSRNEGRENSETSKLASKHISEDSASKPFMEETEPQREQIDRGRPHNEKTSGSFKDSHRSRKEYVQSTSSKDNDTKDHGVLAAGVHSQKNSLKVSRDEMSMENEAKTTNDWPQKSENFREERVGKQSSVNFSRSDSRISDNLNIFAESDGREFGQFAGEDPFVDIGMKKQSIKYDSESTYDWPEKSKHLVEERIVKLPSVNSSRAHSNISDVENIFVSSKEQSFGHEIVEDPFVGISKGSIPGEDSQTSTQGTAAVVFDKSDSESDGGYDFGTTYDEQESVCHMPSKLPGNSSVSYDSSGSTKIMQPNNSSLFPTRNNSSPDLSEILMAKDGSEMDNNMAVKFDYSEAPSSESDDGMNMLGHTVKQDSRDTSSRQNSSSQSVRSEIIDKNRESLGSPLRGKGYSGFGRKQPSLSSDYELMSEEILKERDQGKGASPGKLSFRNSAAGKKKEHSRFGSKHLSLSSDDELMSEEILEKSSRGKGNSPGKLSFQKSSSGKPASRSAESQIEAIGYGNESDSDSGEGLKFGKLTGGFRHKGYNQPSYLKNQLGRQSLLKKETDDAATSNGRSISPPAVESPRINKTFGNKKGTRIPVLSFDSDTDSSEDEEYKSSGYSKERVTPNSAEVIKKSSLGASRLNYGSSTSDSDADAPEEPLARKNLLRVGISRRTKAPSSSAEPNSFLNARWNESKTPDSDATGRRKPRVSDSSENQQESESQWKNSKKLENYERPTSANAPYYPAKSSFWVPPEQPSSAKAAHGTLNESNMRLKSEALEDDASNDRKPVETRRKMSEVLDSDEEDEKRSTRTNTFETPRELESERKSSMQWENPKRPTSTKVTSKPTKSSAFSPPKQYKAASKPSHPSFPERSEQLNSTKPTTSTSPEPRSPQKASVSEQPSSPQTKAESSVSNENPKTATLNKTNSNKRDGTQKASHVHPKLPDYDSFIQAFRKNRPFA
ncbi:dentin sialophosphoprotein-like [Dorcoceras hygrometricum]|uniref:Dentin sialophosphoprotein-like n=1 Tax=Dorcoceras hygrometricum TaxID=472368 RepID=A0A2Z7C9Q8_9LAMI|nr:dentin sialophosphoprotein-like [Dorcoceras hygrometricum]